VDNSPFSGNGLFKFAFTESNGTVLWTNDGTGGNGTEPTGAVTVTVSNGRYSLALGDVSLANMRALPSSVFTRNDVRLKVWFSDGQGFELLSPDRVVGSVAYSMVSGWATNSLTARELSRPPEILGIAPSGLADAPFVKSLYFLSGPSNQLISFKIRSLDPASSYSVTGLPDGLTLNAALGVITGNLPATASSHEVTLQASNAYGSGNSFTLYLVTE